MAVKKIHKQVASRHVQLLTLIDAYSRKVLIHMVLANKLNKLLTIKVPFYHHFLYLCLMSGINKYIDHSTSRILMFAASKCFTCSYSKFSKKLNYFPTCKDFHN